MPKAPTRTELRRLEAAAMAEYQLSAAMYLHTILVQTTLPHSDPGDETRDWVRRNGSVALVITSLPVRDPEASESNGKTPVVIPGLPYGPKARAILAHLTTEALLTDKPVIETEDTLTRFVTAGLGMDPNGRNVRVVKNQLTRLAACTMRLSMREDERTAYLTTPIVSAFDLLAAREDGERVLWPKTIRLSDAYFASLQRHAVPLNETHLRALSNSSLDLDLYCWLAQRLHRISPGEPELIPWASLFSQFGGSYRDIRNFRYNFKIAVGNVTTAYREARIALVPRGLELHWSRTPIPPKAILLPWKTA